MLTKFLLRVKNVGKLKQFRPISNNFQSNWRFSEYCPSTAAEKRHRLSLQKETARRNLPSKNFFEPVKKPAQPYRNEKARDLRGSTFTREVTDRRAYEKTCQNLTENNSSLLNSPQSFTPPMSLAFLPFNANVLKDDQKFVDQILLCWYHKITKQIDKIPVFHLPTTLHGLALINEVTKGNLMKKLTVEQLQPLINVVLKDKNCLELSSRKFMTFLNSTKLLLSNESPEIKREISEKLFEILPIYVQACAERKTKFSQDVPYEFSLILYNFVQLNVAKPSDEYCVKNIVSVASQLFHCDPREFRSVLAYLGRLEHLQTVFFAWEISPEEFEPQFWNSWFQRIVQFYPSLETKERIFRAVILKKFLAVALRYEKFDELTKNRAFWLQNFANVKEIVLFEPELLDELASKLNKHDNPNVQITLKEIYDAVKSVQEKTL